MLEPSLFDIPMASSPMPLVPDAVDRDDISTARLIGHAERSDLDLPRLSEAQVVRHFTRLSQLNYCVDTGFYPLGSCTMKYNPKLLESVAALDGFTGIHPLQPCETVQGALQLMFELQEMLRRISGMAAVSLQPAAGAHGELTCLLMAKRYFEQQNEAQRHKVLVPDSAHGTNPASASIAGFTTIPVRSDENGCVDLEHLRALLDRDTAALMLTVPNTLGVFDRHVIEVTCLTHEQGALAFCDGANLNAIMGQVRPADLGFDLMQFNLHKTFGTPHGGGGPGAGPVGASSAVAPFLPSPIVTQADDGIFRFATASPSSIGRMKLFHGQFSVLVKAHAYLSMLGEDGVREASARAVLNANYLLSRLRGTFDVPYDKDTLHEFVLAGTRQARQGVRTLDIAKRLLDYRFHPPTIYFPLIVDEALMIEPTESEEKDTLDAFAEALIAIAHEAETDPDLVKHAPHSTPVGRLDEVQAARRPKLCYG